MPTWSQIKEINPTLVNVQVEVPWENVKQELDSNYRKLQQQAHIRGFRPGKVPMSVVRQMMGKTVKSEVRSTLIQKGISTAIDEHSLDLISIQDMENAPEIIEGKPLTFTAKFEIRPKIESIDTSALEIEKVIKPVTDDIVDSEVQRLRESNADLINPDEERASQAGDILTVDYTVFIGEEEQTDLGAFDRQIELGVNRLLPQLEEGLLNLEIGAKKTIKVDFPDDFVRKELQGVTADFNVTVKEIKEKKLPALDDEFAKDLEYESLESMKSTLREELEEKHEEQADAQLREKLADMVIDKNPIPIPPTLLEKQEKAMRDELTAFQQYSGLDPSISDEISGEIRKRAERKVRGVLLFSQIARDQGMEITEQDIENKLQALAESTGKHIAKLRADYKDNMKEALESQMMEEKLFEYLMSKATIKTVTEDITKETKESSTESSSEESASEE